MMQNQEKSELAVQLQGALDSRRIIEQAKGVLMGRHGIPARTAFEQLRAQARAEAPEDRRHLRRGRGQRCPPA